MKELDLLQRKIRKVEKSKGDYVRAIETERKTHTFLWKTLDSMPPHFEKRTAIRYPTHPDYSQEDLFIRELLGLQTQNELTWLLASVRKNFDLSAISVKLETKEGNVADRKSIDFQISRHGSVKEPIWGTRIFVRGREINKDNSFGRLKHGLKILEFINSRVGQSRPQSP